LKKLYLSVVHPSEPPSIPADISLTSGKCPKCWRVGELEGWRLESWRVGGLEVVELEVCGLEVCGLKVCWLEVC